VHVPAEQLDRTFKHLIRRMPPMVFPGESPVRTAELERGWWRDLVALTFRTTDASLSFPDFEQYFDALFQHFAAPDAWIALPGAHETLAALRKRGLRTGIVSNFDHRLQPILRGLDLDSLFDVLVLPADAGAAKPSARIFLLALERLGLRDSGGRGADNEQRHKPVCQFAVGQ
jgi:putative hydrolase of the HAD superfamily